MKHTPREVVNTMRALTNELNKLKLEVDAAYTIIGTLVVKNGAPIILYKADTLAAKAANINDLEFVNLPNDALEIRAIKRETSTDTEPKIIVLP